MSKIKPRVYMAGAVEALPDLGTGWRRDLAAELEAAGCEPVWPTGGLKYIAEKFPGDLAQAAFERKTWEVGIASWKADPVAKDHPICECFEELGYSDVVLVRWCADVGSGTRAEIAYAVAIGLPVVVWLHDLRRCEGRWDDVVHALGCVTVTERNSSSQAVSAAHRLGFERVAARDTVEDKS